MALIFEHNCKRISDKNQLKLRTRQISVKLVDLGNCSMANDLPKPSFISLLETVKLHFIRQHY